MSTIDPADRQALRRKYQLERDKRLRADGIDQYRRPDGQLARYLDDPHTPRAAREPRTDHVTVAFVGGGLAGLITGARLKEAGVTDVRMIDKAGDFGGTWYWNRYPGAQCDTASMVYLPLLEETGHMPSEKYAHGPEILEHCQRIAKHYDLYDRALFHTEVTGLRWDATRSCWVVATDRGDRFTAQFVAMGIGPLHVAKLPGIAGIETFAGHSFHTSRWDYDYTGGDPSGAPMHRLADRRVAIIGTGATAVQCVPHLARACQELYVFQRTPSSVDVRDNHPIDPGWFAEVATAGWQQHWLDNFATNQTLGMQAEDLVMDGWTDIARRVRAQLAKLAPGEFTPERFLEVYSDSDDQKMNEIRARVDSIVEDPSTALALKAWYRQLCKRPCFHDEYLQAYNRPNTHLVDTDGQGVERITPTGVVAGGRHYPVDCVIYASGFEVGTGYTRRAGFDLTGRDGRTLSQYWLEGMRSLHGIHVHGFPNAFVVTPLQGGNLISNVPHNFTATGRAIADTIAHAVTRGHGEVEVTQAAEDAWVDLLLTGPGRARPADCTPGYYNNEGQAPGPQARYAVGYPQGPMAFFNHLDAWRTAGGFAGLEFR